MRTWFITGISRGLGLALAQEVMAQGDRVVGTVRSVHEPEIVNHDMWKVLHLDLSDNAAVEHAVHEAFAAFGRVDVIVNNAGSGLFGALEETTLEETRHLFDVDVFAPITIIRTALPYLRAQGSGHIINITSIAGRAPGTGASVYAAAKAALEGLSAALANEVGPLGIRVTAVAPGQFRTSFMSDTSVHKAPRDTSPYSSTVGASLSGLAKTYNRQLGDPRRAAGIIYKIAAASNPPLHLLLGSDAYAREERKIARIQEEMATWREDTESTDFGVYEENN